MEKTSLRTLRVNGSIMWSKLCREENLAWAWEINQGPSCPQAWVLTACQAESPVLAHRLPHCAETSPHGPLTAGLHLQAPGLPPRERLLGLDSGPLGCPPSL